LGKVFEEVSLTAFFFQTIFKVGNNMKRIVSIALLLLFTFNLGGYYFLFWVLQARADQQLSKQFDENINNVGQAFEIKIPLTLPYPIQQTDFERKDGEFVYKNEHFRLVKQKLENDTLTIVCVKNQKANQLTNVMDEFSAKTSSDQTDGLMLSGKVLQDYEPLELTVLITISGWSQRIDQRSVDCKIFSEPRAYPSPPPRA
jgi:hypothetical protein